MPLVCPSSVTSEAYGPAVPAYGPVRRAGIRQTLGVHGHRLIGRSSELGELSDREIGEIGADLCEALDHAHSRGVIHRDIKPQNVQVVDGQPRAKLMDFGIALVADAAGLTATGDVVGTLAYMSPEQAEGREAGPEADVYSLALTLYECWSGENPHRRGNAVATARSSNGRVLAAAGGGLACLAYRKTSASRRSTSSLSLNSSKLKRSGKSRCRARSSATAERMSLGSVSPRTASASRQPSRLKSGSVSPRRVSACVPRRSPSLP